MPDLTSTATDPGAQLEQMRIRAALTGAFDPRTMLRDSNQETPAREILREIGKDCEELQAPDGTLTWRMKIEARRAQLRKMHERGELVDAAQAFENASVTELDAFGRSLLDAILRPALPGIEEPGLDARYAAAQALDPILQRDTAQDIGVHIEQASRSQALAMVRPRALFGRSQQLENLSIYVRGSGDDGPLFVSGVGGSGKSALLAEFVYQHTEQRQAPVVWLDFDNVAMIQMDQVRLSIEFVRQLASTSVRHANLHAFVQRARALLDERFEELGRSYGNTLGMSQLWHLWVNLVSPHLGGTPILLVLDTFEEVLVRDPTAQALIEQWLSWLSEEGQLTVRCVVSGRIAPTQWWNAVPAAGSQLVVDDLDPASAVALLRSLLPAGRHVGMDDLAGLVRRFTGNPLVLKLLGHMLADADPGLMSDLLHGSAIAAAGAGWAQGYLYRRILDRMREPDPDVRALAYPGLVLRRVTPHVIEQVLASACTLGEISPERAVHLFDRLASHIWLVECAISGQTLYHRRDLRRVMLRMMAGKDRDTALRIHTAAQHYYAHGKATDLTESEQRLEAQYHSLFLNAVPDLPVADAAALVKSLGGDIECLAPAVRTALKAAAGLHLSDDERALLDPARLQRFDSLIARQQLDSGTMAGSVFTSGDSSDVASKLAAMSMPSAPSSPAIDLSGTDLYALQPSELPAIDTYFAEQYKIALTHSDIANLASMEKLPQDVRPSFASTVSHTIGKTGRTIQLSDTGKFQDIGIPSKIPDLLSIAGKFFKLADPTPASTSISDRDPQYGDRPYPIRPLESFEANPNLRVQQPAIEAPAIKDTTGRPAHGGTTRSPGTVTALSPDELHTSVELAFARGDFQGVMALADGSLQTFFNGKAALITESTAASLINTAVWRTLLAALALGEEAALRNMVFDHIAPAALQVNWSQPINRYRNSLGLGDAFAVLSHMLELDFPNEVFHKLGTAVSTTESLRVMQVAFQHDAHPKVLQIRLDMLQDASPGLWSCLRVAAAPTKGASTITRAARELLEAAAVPHSGKTQFDISDLKVRRTSITLPPIQGLFSNSYLGLGLAPELYPAYRGAMEAVGDDALQDFIDESRRQARQQRDALGLPGIPDAWEALARRQQLRSSSAGDLRSHLEIIEAADRSGQLSQLVLFCKDHSTKQRQWDALARLHRAYTYLLTAKHFPAKST